MSVGSVISNTVGHSKQEGLFNKGSVSSISQIPQNNFAFNVEFFPGCGAIFARAAGSRVYLQGTDIYESKGGSNIIVKLPSGCTKSLPSDCLGQVGTSSNEGHL